MELIELYRFYINTIELLCINSIDTEEIEDVLEELEGDYYTFLNTEVVNTLYEASIIDFEQLSKSNDLKKLLDEISVDEWNAIDFTNNIKWKRIRIVANLINQASRSINGKLGESL